MDNKDKKALLKKYLIKAINRGQSDSLPDQLSFKQAVITLSNLYFTQANDLDWLLDIMDNKVRSIIKRDLDI